MFGIKCEKTGHLGIVTFCITESEAVCRDSEMWLWEFEDAIGNFESDQMIWAVLVTSDLKSFLPERFETGTHSLGGVVDTMTKPVVGAIQKDAFGAGFELIMCCDISVCRDTSLFSIGHLKEGIIPGDGGTQRLPRIVGQGRALELLLTGRIFDAAEAENIGLVQYVSDQNNLDLALDICRQIIDKAPISMKYIKEAVKSGLDMPLTQGLVLEADLSVILQSTKDRSEGLSSFFDKRKPKFRGH